MLLRDLLGPPVQLAYAVRDVDAAAHRFADHFGAGPFFVRRHIPIADGMLRGEPCAFDHTSAYGQWGEIMVELVQDHTVGPSPVRDLAGGGTGIGLHHHAHFVSDFSVAQRSLRASGIPELFSARTGSTTRFAFHDSQALLGHLIEIYEPHPRLLDFYEMVRAAAVGWDGSEVIRDLTS
jgi:hypothetical protein